MTSSQWLDIAVLVVAFIAAISGWRSGALGSLMSFVGVVLGAIAGVMLAPHIVSHVHSPRAKLFAALFLILALVVIGEVAGVVLGRAVRGAIRNRGIRTVDSIIGVALQLVVVLVAAWLLATPLTSSGPAEPGRGGARLQSACAGGQVRARMAQVGAQADVDPAQHLGPARGPAAVRPHPDPGGRRPRRLPGRQSRRRQRPAQRGEDPRRGAGLPEGAGGNRFRHRPQPGDVQRARGGRARTASPSRPRARPTTPPSSPTTPTPTSRSSTCRTCRSGRWCSPSSRPSPAPTRWCSAIPAAVISPPPRRRVREIIELNGPDIYRIHHGQPRGLHHQRDCAAR